MNHTIEAKLKGASLVNTPVEKTKEKTKRPSKGMRKHNRKVKQEARRVSVPGAEVKKSKRPA